MKQTLIVILLTIQILCSSEAQSDSTFEIQADIVDSSSHSEIQHFYDKFNLWTASKETKAEKLELDEKLMINNFILFSEDGLIMKDLNFHTIESCKKQILQNLPQSELEISESNWIYVTLESHVNKKELIEILEFLETQKIDYHFGSEDEFVPQIMGK